MSQPTVKFGTVEFQGKDIATPGVQFDRLAISGCQQLLLISLVAETQRIKQIRAILSGGAKATISASGIKVKQPGQSDWDAITPSWLLAARGGYQVFTHKLGYGQAHALFLARMPGFMKVVTEESLWQELNSDRFTTPILREWMPYIETELRARNRLEDAHGFNCSCGVLSATTRALDEIVSEGLQSYQIVVPTSRVQAAVA